MSAWTFIASTELTSNQSNIEFTSISGSYSDLILLLSLRVNRTGREASRFYVQINGSTSSVAYAARVLQGDGFGVSSNTYSGDGLSLYLGHSNAADSTSNTFSNGYIYIPNYTSSITKSISSDSSVATNTGSEWTQSIFAGRASITSAVTSIKIIDSNANSFVQYSSAWLYGITKGSSGGVSVS